MLHSLLELLLMCYFELSHPTCLLFYLLLLWPPALHGHWPTSCQPTNLAEHLLMPLPPATHFTHPDPNRGAPLWTLDKPKQYDSESLVFTYMLKSHMETGGGPNLTLQFVNLCSQNMKSNFFKFLNCRLWKDSMIRFN